MDKELERVLENVRMLADRGVPLAQIEAYAQSEGFESLGGLNEAAKTERTLRPVMGSTLSPAVGGAADFATSVGAPLLASNPLVPAGIQNEALGRLMELFQREPTAATLGAGAIPAAIGGLGAASAAAPALPLAKRLLINKFTAGIGAGELGRQAVTRLLGGNQ